MTDDAAAPERISPGRRPGSRTRRAPYRSAVTDTEPDLDGDRAGT
ncbi:hypothetical protein ACIQJT_01140 [Streptomyces sp. NPDC091972]